MHNRELFLFFQQLFQNTFQRQNSNFYSRTKIYLFALYIIFIAVADTDEEAGYRGKTIIYLPTL